MGHVINVYVFSAYDCVSDCFDDLYVYTCIFHFIFNFFSTTMIIINLITSTATSLANESFRYHIERSARGCLIKLQWLCTNHLS